MIEKEKLILFVPATSKIEDVLKIVSRTANTESKFETLKFLGAFGHHSFFRNIEKAYATYSVDMDEVSPAFIRALNKVKETLAPKLDFFPLTEIDD